MNSRQVPTRADSSSIDYDDITDGTTTSSLESINDTLHDDTPYYHHHSGQYEHHGFEQVTNNETASYKIMSLLDTAGAPRICYDRLVALLKKLSKGGFDVKKAVNRDTLMRRLERKNTARPQIQSSIINKQEVFSNSKLISILSGLLFHPEMDYLGAKAKSTICHRK